MSRAQGHAQGRMLDQMRTMGPAEAVRAGASYLVVGRPMIAAADPRAAAEKIVVELKAGIRDPGSGIRGTRES